MKKLIPLIGRIFIAMVFVLAGLYKLDNFSSIQEYMVSYNISNTSIFLIVAIALEIIGGLSILTGYKARWGALILIIYLIGSTYMLHRDFSDQIELMFFMKNVAILGGLIFITYHGSGAYSLDNKM